LGEIEDKRDSRAKKYELIEIITKVLAVE